MGKPLWALLGEKVRDSIPLYANHGVFFVDDTRSPYDINRIELMKQQGYALYKWDPFTGGGDVYQAEVDAQVAKISAVRELVGPDFPLGIDAHSRYSTQGGKAIAQGMESENISFFEEPVQGTNLAGYQEIAAATTIPLATGEEFYTEEQFEPFLDPALIGILQPDVGVCGVLTAMKVASRANRVGISINPHTWCSPIIARATAHLVTVLPNLGFMEYAACSPDVSWESELISPPNVVVNGQLDVPPGPGLGVTLNDTLVRERLVT